MIEVVDGSVNQNLYSNNTKYIYMGVYRVLRFFKTISSRPKKDIFKALMILHDIFYKRDVPKVRNYLKKPIPENDDGMYYIPKMNFWIYKNTLKNVYL